MTFDMGWAIVTYLVVLLVVLFGIWGIASLILAGIYDEKKPWPKD